MLLKRLEDAINDGDQIHAVIRGSAINNDAADKVSYTAPSISGQTKVILQALALSGVSADKIGYIECHGTGTQIGDQIELSTLTDIFKHTQGDDHPCYFSSLKSNIGHLNSAAGVAGLIKTILILQNKTIPPAVNFSKLTSSVDTSASRLKISSQSVSMANSTPLIAGVSSFGIGGTNAHVIVESSDQYAIKTQHSAIVSPQIISLSAKSNNALRKKKQELVEFLKINSSVSLDAIAFTNNTGRTAFKHRKAIVSDDISDLKTKLIQSTKETNVEKYEHADVVFLISGQGTQCVNIGKSIYSNNAHFRKHLAHCAKLLHDMHDIDILRALYPQQSNEDAINDTLMNPLYAHTILFSFNYSLSKWWMDMGITPKYLLGHSLGEYVAACLSGVISLESALSLVYQRANLIRSVSNGKMLAVACSPEQAKSFVNEQCNLAAVNSSTSCTLAVDLAGYHGLIEQLNANKIYYKILPVSHAYHSFILDGIMSEFEKICEQMTYAPATIPYLSCLTGSFVKQGDTISSDYWPKQMRQTVKFGSLLEELKKNEKLHYLEVGPGKNLCQIVSRDDKRLCVSSLSHNGAVDDYENLLSTLGEIWEAGYNINWHKLYDGSETLSRIPLPTYPFERQYYRLGSSVSESAKTKQQLSEVQTSTIKKPTNFLEVDLAKWWSEILGVDDVGIDDNFFELGGNSLHATQINTRLYEKYNIKLSLKDFLTEATIEGVVESILLAEQCKE